LNYFLTCGTFDLLFLCYLECTDMRLRNRILGGAVALALLGFLLVGGKNPFLPKLAPYLAWTQVHLLHQLGFKGNGITIAVIDEGFETTHPLIQSQFEEAGYNTDNHGENVSESRLYKQGTFASESHGTHISGILVSQNPTYGGITPGSHILPVKLGTQGGDEAFLRAFKFATESNARIINLSISLSFYDRAISPKIRDLIESLAQADKLIVIAAGNDASPLTQTHYGRSLLALAESPQAEGRIFLVGAYAIEPFGLRFREQKADFSCYPGDLSHASSFLTAPGVDISGPTSHKETNKLSGTSMAAPMVAGVAAILMEAFPQFSSKTIAFLLREGARTLAMDGSPLPPALFGLGILDAWGAYQKGKELQEKTGLNPTRLQTLQLTKPPL
jgi:subtilisin family serine protease